ncbi:unnamed protein product, partial [marine sediment metagenome]
MIRIGVFIRPQVEKALAETDDAEVKWRLKIVLEKMKEGPERTVFLGPYELKKPTLQLYDADGTMYVGAENITKGGESIGPGLVVANAKRKFQILSGGKFRKSWKSHYGED